MLFISSSLSSIHRRGLPVLQCEHDKQLWLPSKGSPLPIYLHWPTRGRKHLYSRESISPNNVRHWNADLVIWGPRLQPLQVRQKTSATGRRGPCRRDPWRTWIMNRYSGFDRSILHDLESQVLRMVTESSIESTQNWFRCVICSMEPLMSLSRFCFLKTLYLASTRADLFKKKRTCLFLWFGLMKFWQSWSVFRYFCEPCQRPPVRRCNGLVRSRLKKFTTWT